MKREAHCVKEMHGMLNGLKELEWYQKYGSSLVVLFTWGFFYLFFFWLPSYYNLLTFILTYLWHICFSEAAVGQWNDATWLTMASSSKSFQPPIHYHHHYQYRWTTIHPTPPSIRCPPTELRAECSMGRGWTEGQTSVSLSGLYCLGLIVLRAVEKHNRRRAGELRSSRERGKGEEQWGAAFVYRGVKKKKKVSSL